jgi:hypothetical protein
MSPIFQLFAYNLDDPLHPACASTPRFSVTEYSIIVDVPPIETPPSKENPAPAFPLTDRVQRIC